MEVFVKLTVAGANTGPLFNLFADTPTPEYSVAFATDVPKSTLLTGATYTVPNDATKVLVRNVGGVCDEDLELDIVVCETTTTTTTQEPATTTTTTTLPPTTTTTTTAFVGMQIFLDEGEDIGWDVEVENGGSYTPYNDPLAPNVGNFAILTIYAVNCDLTIETGTAVMNTTNFELDDTANPIPFTITSGASKNISVEFYGSSTEGAYTTDVGINHKIDGSWGPQFIFTLTQNVQSQ